MLFDIVYWIVMSVLVINFASTWVYFAWVGFVNVVFRDEFDKLWLVRYKTEKVSGDAYWDEEALLVVNNKTGKSEKLEEMEHRLAQLEQQLGDK